MQERKIEVTVPQELLDQVGEPIGMDQRPKWNCVFVPKGGRDFCIASIEGVPCPGYDAEGNPTKEPYKSKFVKSVMSNMGEKPDEGMGY